MKMKVLAVVVVLISTLSGAQIVTVGQSDVERIVGAAMVRHSGMEFLEILADSIGGRVTGVQNLQPQHL